MVKLWNQESAQWRIELLAGEETLSQRIGDQPRQLIIGLGEHGELTLELLRRAAAKAVKTVCSFGGESALLDAAPAVEAFGSEGASALALGAALAHYQPESWKERKEKPFALYLSGAEGMEDTLAEAAALAKSICFARDLVNCPANKLTPIDMAQRMTEEAKKVGVETLVLDEEQTRALGMDAFLTVGTSAVHPARLIVLRWKGGRDGEAPIALVGKGVTCDTGGYCLKTPGGLKGTRGDMAGGAAVCGAILALAENRVPVNAVAVIPAVENRLSADSFIPGDVIGSMSGKTIEVGNTDAEGRLILADAVTYAIRQENAAAVVDIATLTGAVVAALGFTTAGLLTNNDEFFARFQEAAGRAGEQYWRLPAFPEYKKMIESPVADISNVSSDGCGCITAGLFVGAFTEDKPWIHLDIAGTAWVDAPRWEYQAKGATGAGVTSLYELCKSFAKEA